MWKKTLYLVESEYTQHDINHGLKVSIRVGPRWSTVSHCGMSSLQAGSRALVFPYCTTARHSISYRSGKKILKPQPQSSTELNQWPSRNYLKRANTSQPKGLTNGNRSLKYKCGKISYLSGGEYTHHDLDYSS